LAAARAIEDEAQKVVLLVRAAPLQAKAGDKAGAQETLRQALACAEAIEEQTPRGLALREIASAQLHLGDVQAAIDLALKEKNAYRRNQLLFCLAYEQAGAGDVVGARRTAGHITDSQKDSALAAVARAQAKAGGLPAAAQ